MDTKDVLALGLGIAPPWRLVGQRLETDKRAIVGAVNFGEQLAVISRRLLAHAGAPTTVRCMK